MARNVYFDPFGSRVEGYRAGVQDEQSLQGATRAARAIDWDYNNMKPLELDTARRVNAYGAYADPFLRADIKRQDYRANLQDALGFTRRTGNEAPSQYVDFKYFQPQQTVDDPTTGLASYSYTDPFGNLHPYSPTPGNYRDESFRQDPASLGLMQSDAQFWADWYRNQAQIAQSGIYPQAMIYQTNRGAAAGGAGGYNPIQGGFPQANINGSGLDPYTGQPITGINQHGEGMDIYRTPQLQFLNPQQPAPQAAPQPAPQADPSAPPSWLVEPQASVAPGTAFGMPMPYQPMRGPNGTNIGFG